MAESTIDIREIKLALKKEELNFKILQNPTLNSVKDSVIFVDECSKVKLRGKIVRSFNEGEVHHWPLLNHENIDRLIDILRVRDDMYIYLTIHHEVTLKNIVHDENFVYDSRCFDRKRSYAKGIFSGLSYLHGKSLTLMNLCDDNIVISTIDDRAVITKFDHLTIARKAIKSRLNLPEMYMAPETEKGEFDALKAEIWASGVLMLDMFLAHMIPWAVVNYKTKKVIQIVDTLSLDLLQAANAGSIVTAADLVKFKAFLKCFFKQNPQERIPAKYASIASFLQNRDLYKILGDPYESVPFPEYILSENFLPEEHMTVCLNPTYDPSSNSISPCVQNSEILSTNNNPYILKTANAEQTKRTIQMGENKVEADETLSGTSKTRIKAENEKENSSLSFYKCVSPTADSEVKDDLQTTSKSWETVKGDARFVTKSRYNCNQTNSLSFIIPQRSSKNTTALQLISKRNYYSNNRPSEKQSEECNDFGLDFLFNDNDFDEVKNNSNDNPDRNTVVEYDRLNTVSDKNITEISKPGKIQAETQVKQHIPYYPTSLQTSEKRIIKPPRNSKAPPFLFTPEIKLVASKIIHLRKCFYSIQTHRKVNISEEFQNKQRKIIKEYQNLLSNEYFRLHEMLRKNYGLKIEDIKKLMSYVSSGSEYISVNQNFNDNYWNALLQTCEKKCDMNSVKSYSDDKPDDMNVITWKIQRKHSYYRAIENADNNVQSKWEKNDQLNNKESMKNWKRTDFNSSSKMKTGYLTAATKSDKISVEGLFGAERVELVQQHEQWNRSVKTAHEINPNRGTCPKQAANGSSGRIDMTKQHEPYKIGQKDRYLSTVEDADDDRYASSKYAKNKESKNKKVIHTKEKIEHRKKSEKKEKQKQGKNKQKVDEKPDKKEKKQRDLKKREEPKTKWFFSLCPGSRVERTTSIADGFCEVCKLNLDIK